MADAKNIRLNASDDAHPYRLCADPQHLWQILINISFNAVKFTPADDVGAIEISSRIVAGRWGLGVTDDGIGMSADQIPVALSRFGQIDSSFTRKYEGTGLAWR